MSNNKMTLSLMSKLLVCTVNPEMMTLMTLVEHIQRDLLHRLGKGEHIDLRLQALAEHYQSSTRPVRLALAELAAQGTLQQDQGGHWLVARIPRRVPNPVVMVDPSLRLRDLLVSRALRRDGSYIRETETADLLQIGRGSLRRLLAEFSGKGLVDHDPRRGWRVRILDQANLDAFLEVREALELLALDLAFAKLEKPVLREMELANSNGGLDNRLHGYFINRAQNPYIIDFFARHGPYFEMIFDFEGQHSEACKVASDLHLAILSALLADNLAAAKAAMSEHIRGNHPGLEDLML
jgi:DNA-binding GntR family transcriptional regulator